LIFLINIVSIFYLKIFSKWTRKTTE